MGEPGRSPTTNERRFTEVYRAHHAHVLAYARRRVGADLAQDVVSDTFMAAWRHVDDLPEDPLPWLYRAASFEVANRRRAMSRQGRTARAASGLTAVVPDTADGVAWADQWSAAFAFLAESDQEVLRLVAWEDLAPRDAATVLGCSPTAFNVRLHRARRRLVRLVESDERSASASRARARPDLAVHPKEAMP